MKQPTVEKTLFWNISHLGLQRLQNFGKWFTTVAILQPFSVVMSVRGILVFIAYTEYTSAKDVVVSVPTSAATSSTVLRWRQLSNSGSQTDEWALDKIQVTDVISVSTTIFSERFDTVPSVPYVHVVFSIHFFVSRLYTSCRRGLNWQSFSGGSFVAPDCGSISSVGFSSRAAFFSGPSTRSITTQALDLTNARCSTNGVAMHS